MSEFRFPHKSIHGHQRLTCDLLLVIVIVTGGQKLAKDQSRDKHLFHFVLDYRNTLSVVPHADGVVLSVHRNERYYAFPHRHRWPIRGVQYLRVDVNLDAVHGLVSLFVISSVYYKLENTVIFGTKNQHFRVLNQRKTCLESHQRSYRVLAQMWHLCSSSQHHHQTPTFAEVRKRRKIERMVIMFVYR